MAKRRARNLNDLPSGTEYLVDALTKFAMAEGLVSIYEDKAATLKGAELDELARAYGEIDRRHDAGKITRWLSSASIDSHKFGAAGPLVDLFFLFGLLAKRDVAPFSSRRVELGDMIPPADRNEMPAQFAYLVEPANEFGSLVAENLREEFLSEANAAVIDKLKLLGTHIRQHGHADEIFDWIDRESSQTNWSATRVTYLIELLRDTDIDFGES